MAHAIPPSPPPIHAPVAQNLIQSYFENFERLAKEENWDEIIFLGLVAKEEARFLGKPQDEAKICAQLTSTYFYKGNYPHALFYVSRCHELAKEFKDPALFLRALYLKSAIYRALAGKEQEDTSQQALYTKAVETVEEAGRLFVEKQLSDENLKGKIYFNLGAAHADNPKGSLEKAEANYLIALECYKNLNISDEILRTSIRLGKVYLLRENFPQTQAIIAQARQHLTTERIAMQIDYLEAQLYYALAAQTAKIGLARAQILGATEDQQRFTTLLSKIHQD